MTHSITFQWTSGTLALSILCLAVVGAFSWMACQRSGFRKSIVALEALRLVIVLFSLALLNQPESVAKFLPTQRPAIVVLGDMSKSMTTRDVGQLQTSEARQTRAEAIKPLLEESTWKDLAEHMNVVVRPFAIDEDSSDLHAALQLAREDHPNLRAVVLASDGDWNGGQPPVDAAMRYRLEQIPIFTVPVGSQSRQPDVELLSFDVPTFGIVNKGVRIPFTIESSLPRDYLAQIVLTSSNGARQTHEVKVAAMGRTTDAIVWKPEAVGDFTLSLQVPSHPEESLVDNNARSSPIAVREEKLRVLVVESIPRWEYRYLRNALSRDPGVEVSCLLFHPQLSKVGGGNRDYIQAFPEALEQLSQYDVVFLGDVGMGLNN